MKKFYEINATPCSKSDEILTFAPPVEEEIYRTFSESSIPVCRTNSDAGYSFDGLPEVKQQGENWVIESPGKLPMVRKINPDPLEYEDEPTDTHDVNAHKRKLTIARTDTNPNKYENINFRSVEEFKHYLLGEEIPEHDFSSVLKLSGDS